jgi:hypothetical protein
MRLRWVLCRRGDVRGSCVVNKGKGLPRQGKLECGERERERGQGQSTRTSWRASRRAESGISFFEIMDTLRPFKRRESVQIRNAFDPFSSRAKKVE